MYKTAKEMYFAYECNEYRMKQDDVLDEYKRYNVSTEEQIAWKNEYVEMLFDKLVSSNDIRVFSELSCISRDCTSNTYILEKLVDYWLTTDKTDIEKEFSLSFSLLNAINPFVIRKSVDISKQALNIVDTSMHNVISNTRLECTKRVARNCCSEIDRLKNKYI